MSRTKVTKTNIKDALTETEVYDVIKFARSYNVGNIYNQGIFTPEIVNARLKEISLNPIQPTKEGIDKTLSNPKDSEFELRGYSEFFELTDMLYKRQIQYMGNLPSWDFTYTCINANPDDYSKPRYKKDEEILEKFLYDFDYKKEFSAVLRQLIRKEVGFYSVRENEDNVCLQELNPDYCKITGRWENGFLYDFDFIYFMSQPGVDINMFSPAMKKYFNDILKEQGDNYVPSMPVSKRDSKWVYWHQMSPADGFWCFKFNPELVTQIPVFSPMFPDLAVRPLIRNLQTNKYIQEAQKIMIGLIGVNKDSKSGTTKDNLNLNPETIGKFAGLVRAGIDQSISFGVAPLDDVKSFDYTSTGTTPNIYDQFNQTTASSSGNNSRLLYSTDKSNAEDSKNSLSIDEQMAISIYPYFNDFINYFVNKKTKNFKFKVEFQGTQMPNNRQFRLDNSIQLAQMGMVLPQYISAAMGINPFIFKKQMEMAKATDFVDGLTPIITSNQMSNKDAIGGRPKSDNLSDSGQATRDAGSNIDKGGKI